MRLDAAAKILLVEDERFIRVITADALEDAGFSVLEASDAAEAMMVLEARAGDVEVLFTDIRMPGSMDGLELAKAVHARWPSVRLLLTSGDTLLTRTSIPDDGRFLAKPYRLHHVVHELSVMLAS